MKISEAKRIARQRMAMGLMLMLGVFLFSWELFSAPVRVVPLFGYDINNGLPVAERGILPLANPGMHVVMGPPPRYPYARMSILDERIFHAAGEAPLLPPRITLTPEYMEQLRSFEYIRRGIFLEDPSTMLLPCDIDADAFIRADLRIDPTVPGPHVLLFHTHSTEWFLDTCPYDPMTGIMGTGAYLARILAEYYGLEVLHLTQRFDVIDGITALRGAYERMEPFIVEILAENPSIQLVIDLHRDGVRRGVGPFTRYVDGVPTAQLMFFNGLSRRNVDGEPVDVYWLPNPYQQENLQFSFQAQLAANQLFPGLNRRIYLRAYRFSLHMHPRSIFVEVGNQYNTQREAKNAMHPLARILADVVL